MKSHLVSLLSATQQLMAIPSTADNEAALREAYNFMLQRVRGCGKALAIEEFEKEGIRSFLAYRAGRRPASFRIIFNAHLDVVTGQSEQYAGTIKNGKLYGRGAYDMKAAAIILADLFCEFVDKVPYDLALQIVTDEEIAGLRGAHYQIEQGVRGDFVVCGECGRASNVREIANEAKGIALVEAHFNGSSAHSAYPWRADNAAVRAMRFAQLLHERYPIPESDAGETTFSITGITAGSQAPTRIPDSAVVRIDARYVANDPHFRSPKHLTALLKEIDPSISDVRFSNFSAPLYSSPENPLLQQLKAAAEHVEGAPFSFARRNATSDGRFFGDVGDQACEFGIAGEHQHGDDEHITLQAFENYYKTMRRFLTQTIRSEAQPETESLDAVALTRYNTA